MSDAYERYIESMRSEGLLDEAEGRGVHEQLRTPTWTLGGGLRFTLTLRNRQMQMKASGGVKFTTLAEFDEQMDSLQADLRREAERMLVGRVTEEPTKEGG